MASTHNTKMTRQQEDSSYLTTSLQIPGNSLIGTQTDYPPNGFAPPHWHGGATVTVQALEGEVLSGMNGTPPQVYGPGQNFIEMPGYHHIVAEDQCRDHPTKLIAIFVVETAVVKSSGYAALTQLDEGW